jgi:hypothetical protein
MHLRGSVRSVNRCKYVALMMVTIADIRVSPIMMHTPSFVVVRICSFQNTEMGTTAKMMSVRVVYALTKYEKPLKISGLQQVPSTVEFHSLAVGVHWRKMSTTEMPANKTCRMTRAYRLRDRSGWGSRSLTTRMAMEMFGKLKAPIG